MWELMAIGIEMQQRMIETHAQGLKLTQGMLGAASEQAGFGEASFDMGKAQAHLFDQLLGFWSGKR